MWKNGVDFLWAAIAADCSLIECHLHFPLFFMLYHLHEADGKSITGNSAGKKQVPAREKKESAHEESHVMLSCNLFHSWHVLPGIKLQEPHGRGQLLTQTFLCQGFSPPPSAFIASASRRNCQEDGVPDVLYEWDWACFGIGYSWNQPWVKSSSGNKGHRESKDVVLKKASATRDCHVQCCWASWKANQ